MALPFGLKNSPWVFMRVLTTVVEFLCKARGSYVLLPRRLAHSRRVKKPSFVLSVSCVTQSTGSGVPGKLEKVFARASESTDLFGSGSGYSKETSATGGTQSCGTSEFGARVIVKASCDGSQVAGFSGSPGKHGGLGPSLQVVDETPSDLFSSVFLSDEGRSGKVDSVLRGDLSSCVRVGVSEPFVGREAVCSESTRYYSDDRCVNRGLGSSVFNAPTFRSVVSSGIKRPHQLTGIEGCGSSSPRFRTSGGGPISSDSVRQQYCRGVHKSSRGNSFDSLMYDGPVVMGVVHPEGDASVSCSHFRDGECSSGLPFQGKFFVQRVDAAQGGVS